MLLARTTAALAGGPVTCVFLDVDRFNVVNDGLGHAAGDLLLVLLAQRLQATARPTDTLARVGGDAESQGSQFFLVSGSSGVGLPPQYSLFGQIVKGLDVLEKMQNVPTGGGDKPKTDVVINSVAITVADD